MEKVHWLQSMSIGVPEIDRQHQQLLALVNKTWETAQGPDAEAETSGPLRKLCDYVVEHFAAEEALMDPEAYAHYDRHIQEHIDCSMRALDFLETFSEGKNVRLEEFLNFAVEWVQHHIQETDQTLGEFLRHKQPRPDEQPG
ncbi:bacteriohemerythrin [Humidesulfovibrio idahonensis]